MNKTLSTLTAVACVAIFTASAAAQSAARSAAAPKASHKGTWTGTYKYSTGGGDITIRLDSSAAGWTAEVRATSEQNPKPDFSKATEVKVKGDSLEFVVTWGTPVIWAGKFTAQGATGTITAQYWNGTWTAKRKP